MAKGVYKLETPVFHFPKAEPNGLHGFYIPHASCDQPVGEHSLTRQDFKDECDINIIMQNYEHTGVLPSVNDRQPYYADFTTMPTDLQGALELMKDAEEAFMTLPAKVRREFDNDPLAFVDYAGDPEHLDQMREWGLAPPEKAPEAPVGPQEPAVPAAPVSEPPPAAAAPAPSK